MVSDPKAVGWFVSELVRALGKGRVQRLSMIINVPFATSPLERRVVREAGRDAGAGTVRLLEQSIAAALGGDLRMHEPAGTVVVDAGAGVVEAALISLGSVVARSSARVGSADIDRSIQTLLRRDYGIDVSDSTAEQIKIAVGAAKVDVPMVEATGMSLVDQTSVTAILDGSDVQSEFDRYLNGVNNCVRECLVHAGPDLAQDVIEAGIHLAGGAAQWPGLALGISKEFDIPVHVLGEPKFAGIRGAAKCSESPESLEELFLSERS